MLSTTIPKPLSSLCGPMNGQMNGQVHCFPEPLGSTGNGDMAFGKFMNQKIKGPELKPKGLLHHTQNPVLRSVGGGPVTRRPQRRSCIEAELPGRGLEKFRRAVAFSLASLRGGVA